MTVKQTKTQYIDLDNARVEAQIQVMKEIHEAQHCPFCLENLKKYHKQPLIKEGKYWIVTDNQWPYAHTKQHFLLIYKEHVLNLSEIDPQAGRELIELVQWLEQKYLIPGGGIAMRFGDTDYSAGTVVHLHAQVLVPDIEAIDYDDEPVRVVIGKTWKKRGH